MCTKCLGNLILTSQFRKLIPKANNLLSSQELSFKVLCLVYTSLLILNPSWYVGLGRELLLQYLTTHLPMREMSEMWVRPLGQEEPLEKGMASHSSILAWRIPPAEEPGGLQSIGLQSQTWLKWLSTHVHYTKPWGLLSLWLSRKTISERYQQGNAVKTGGKPPSLYSQERTKQVLNNYSSFVLL